jgi:hypothetical protein
MAALSTAERAELERLRAENARLRERADRVSFKVSTRGGVSVYGLGRFPVTLYKEQWQRLLEKAAALLSFMAEHEAELSTKGVRDPGEPAHPRDPGELVPAERLRSA